jgi:hypothetical protein
MRLLNTRTLELTNFVGEHPRYAILSHCWDAEEVLFSDLCNIEEARKKRGFRKVEKACEQAARDDFEFIWVDTTCIDKSSSAELSEAINSMFAWYRRASICYAYLADVEDLKSFKQSRWFTRAWTLQELLAPSALQTVGKYGMEFFSKDWQNLGSKASLSRLISDASGIGREYLEGKDLNDASISMRMSWAAERKATRAEDIAYSLLGLFDVNMPLLYGEGKLKAFRRLQEEIMKISEDETLFAWGDADSDMGSSSADVLASDPKDFAEAKDLVPFDEADDPIAPYSMTHRGLRICLKVSRPKDLPDDLADAMRMSIRPIRAPVMIWSSDDLVWAVLNCHVAHDYRNSVLIPLRSVAADVYIRDISTSVALIPSTFVTLVEEQCRKRAYPCLKEIFIRNSRVSSLSRGVQRRFGFLIRTLSGGLEIAKASCPSGAWNPIDMILRADNDSQTDRFWHASLMLILPSRTNTNTKYATCISLGSANDVGVKTPKAWCYLDDKIDSKNDIDLLTFHNEADSKRPRREVTYVRGPHSDGNGSLKVLIKQEKVHGQRMFVVDIEYINGEEMLNVPQSSTKTVLTYSSPDDNYPVEEHLLMPKISVTPVLDSPYKRKVDRPPLDVEFYHPAKRTLLPDAIDRERSLSAP